MAHCSHSTLVMPIDFSNASSHEWCQSLVMASGTDVSAIRSSHVVNGGSVAHQDSAPSIRALSISVPIYERLLWETAERLQGLAGTAADNAYATLEYRNDMEFLQTGLARALARLSERHGVHCSENVMDVWASESAPVAVDAIEHILAERYVSRLDSTVGVVSAQVSVSAERRHGVHSMRG